MSGRGLAGARAGGRGASGARGRGARPGGRARPTALFPPPEATGAGDQAAWAGGGTGRPVPRPLPWASPRTWLRRARAARSKQRRSGRVTLSARRNCPRGRALPPKSRRANWPRVGHVMARVHDARAPVFRVRAPRGRRSQLLEMRHGVGHALSGGPDTWERAGTRGRSGRRWPGGEQRTRGRAGTARGLRALGPHRPG